MARTTWPPDDPRLTRIDLRGELVAGGLNDRAIAALVGSDVLHRLRHGAYVGARAWSACDAGGQHVLVARAALRQAKADVVLSHLSAAAVWEVPFWDQQLDAVHLTRVDQRAGRREAGINQHLGQLLKRHLQELHGVPVTSPARTALDCAALLDREHAVTVVGDLLHRKLTTPEELAEEAEFMNAWPGSLRHRAVLRLADGRCESVGEHRTVVLMDRQGLPAPVPQYQIHDAGGVLIGRVDFAWPELGVFLEFDGKVKYQKYLKEGESVVDAVLREKRREERLCRATGWRCIRVVWAELYQPERTAAAIRSLFRPSASVAG